MPVPAETPVLPGILVAASGLDRLTVMVGNLIYVALALVAAWGVYCIVMVWMRVNQKRFADESEQTHFLQQLESFVRAGDFAGAEAAVAGDIRALPQMISLAIANRHLEAAPIRHLVADRFQRDILSDLEHRLSWVNTVIKAAPMLGLLGTVIGMMGAFGKLATTENVRPDALAQDISIALITTAAGLSIAIPLVIGTNSINIRISKLEELVEAGIRTFFDYFDESLSTRRP